MDFDQLYKEQFPVVYRYLTGLCGNQTLAEELTHETFCRAIEHSASFQGKCRLSVWLCQIGKNCWLSYLRKAKRQAGDGALEQMTSSQNVEEDLLIQENARQIHQRLHALPEPYREVFTLRVFAELPYTQIGELFGKSENWARVTYYRAKQKIKEGLESEKKAQNIPRTQARTDTLAVTIRQERQDQEMTALCLQGAAAAGKKREIRSGRRVWAEAAPSHSPHSERLKKEISRPRTPI